MDILHKILLASEITVTAIAVLITISALLASLRAIFSKSIPWNAVTGVTLAESRAAREGWPHRAVVAFDIAFNVIILRGQQDETISTHSYRAFLEGKLWGKLMCRWLNGFQPNHGIQAAAGDLQRASARVAVLKGILGQ